MPTAKETYRGSLTRGILNARESQADMVIHVTGLDGGRSSLRDAINTAIVGRQLHPDDLSIPLRYATARWLRGDDNLDEAEALVFLGYDKRGTSQSEATDAFNIANVTVRYITVKWYGENLQDPPQLDTPVPITNEKSNPFSGNPKVKRPYPQWIEVPIWDIDIPVVLSNSPIASIGQSAGKINQTTEQISDYSFPANTLRINGLYQRVTKLDDGDSVSYEFDVRYSFSYRADGWTETYLVDTDPGEGQGEVAWAVVRQLQYTPVNFPLFPLS